MKKLVLFISISAVFSGNVFAENNNQKSGKDNCLCKNCSTSSIQESSFQSLFPEYELKAPFGG